MPAEQSGPRPSPRLRRSPPVVAIVGATGAVGKEFLRVLAERRFPMRELRLYASPRSAGSTLPFEGANCRWPCWTETASSASISRCFLQGAALPDSSRRQLCAAGAVVIDNSSAFRLEREVPLVVPEINPHEIANHAGIIANPNCAAIVALVPLWPIHRRNRIRRVILATYQAASGAGAAAMAELQDATPRPLAGEPFAPKVLPHPYAFNLFSHDTAVDPATGYNQEETKVMAETQKIFGDPDIRIGVTCIRVPVLRAHAIAVTIECERPIDPR